VSTAAIAIVTRTARVVAAAATNTTSRRIGIALGPKSALGRRSVRATSHAIARVRAVTGADASQTQLRSDQTSLVILKF
jgi:hypothetical protein